MDYDPLVVKLNKDISAIEEVMGAALQQHKFQYIFEGQHGSANILVCGDVPTASDITVLPHTRPGTSYLLHSDKWSAVLQEDQRVWYQEDV